MNKTFTLLLSLLFILVGLSSKLSATHIMGGEIIWECQANGQYVFTLKVYRDCNGVAFNVNNHALEVHNYPNVGVITQIPVNFFSVTDITPACEGSPCATLVPSDPDISGAIEEYILVSNAVTLNGVPGANGWTFTWTYGDRNAAIDNIVNAQNFGITLRAQMFAYNGRDVGVCFDNSPNFFQKPSSIICAGEKFTYNHSAFDRELDSLVYSWANPLDGNFCGAPPCTIGALFEEDVTPVNVNFDAGNGYAFDSPYPDTSLDPRNEPAVLDSQTGEITYTSYNSGEFVSVIRVEAFKCGQKVAEIYRELQTVITSGCASNESPVIPSPFANNTYFDTVKVGELVNFDISVFDTLRTGNPKDDSIFFYASGIQFGDNYTSDSTGCLNPPCATLSSPAPDTGVGTYTTSFNWQITCDHVANNTPDCITSQNTYLFIIRALDDFCPTGGQALATFAITVLEDTLVKSPPIHCADVQANGDVIIDWNQTPDPDSSFIQWKIYSSTNLADTFNLIDSISDYNTTNYTHLNAGANNQSVHYIVRAESGCHQNWFYINNDTISTMYIEPTFNDTCVFVSWNELSNPLPDGSGSNYDIYREFPIGSGFTLYKSIIGTSFCDTFSVCSDSVTYRIDLSNTGNGCNGSSSNTKGIQFQYPVVTATASLIDSVTCNGFSNASAMVNTVGGTEPFDYLWSDSQTNDTASNLSAGTYSVVVSDLRNCSDTTALTIIEPPAFLINSIDTFDISCNGLSDGRAKINASGGRLPYTYSWSNSQVTDSAVGLAVGTYRVTVLDNQSCVRIAQVEINEPPILNATISDSSMVSCNGLSDARAAVNASGGTQPYTYLWSDNQVSDTATNLSAGNYTVTLSDANNCSSIATTTITEPNTLIASIGSSSNVSCNGFDDGRANVTASGGTTPFTYLWNNNQTTDTAFNLIAGSYTVTVTDSSGCDDTTTINILEPSTLSTTTTVSSTVSCNGFSDAIAYVTANGGTGAFTYLWSNNQTTDTAQSLASGTYSVTVSDVNGCSIIDSAIITEPAILEVSTIDSIDVTCNGFNDGSATISAVGGTIPYTYIWSDNQTTATASNLTAGVYLVTVSDNNGCSFSDSIIVNEPAILQATITAENNVSCNGLSDASAVITGSGGTTPYTYLWSDNQVTDTAKNLTAGNFTVTLSDANSCSTTAVAIITEPIALTALTGDTINVSCNGLSDGQANVSASGGTLPYTYLWSDSQVTDTAFNLSAGSYTVTVSDSNNCSTTANFLITEPNLLTTATSVLTNVSCQGLMDASGYVTANGGTSPYTYLWSNNQSSDTTRNLSAGNYIVTVSDANACFTIDSINISQPAALGTSFTSSNNVSCFNQSDGSATITASGGTTPYTYFWSNNDSTASINGLDAGTYFVIVSDANGCSLNDTIIITEPNQLTTDLTAEAISCFGFGDGKIKAQSLGGTVPYEYSWSSSQTGDSISNLNPGTYFVTTTDSNNCTIIDTAEMVEPLAISLSVSADDTICVNVPKQLDASASGGTGPFTYTWSDNFGNDSTILVNPSEDKNYSVTVTDVNNCPSVSQEISIKVRNIFDDFLELNSSGNICRGDSALLTYTFLGDLDPYTISFNNGLANLPSQKVSPPTTTQYIITVNDICNNSISDSALVEVSDPPAINLNDTIIEGCEDLTVSFTNSTPANYIYVWNLGNGLTSTEANPIYTYTEPGTYNVGLDVSTPQGCMSESTADYRVQVNPRPEAIITANPTVTDIENSTISFSSFFTDANDWLWSFANGTTSKEESPSTNYQDTGSYRVSLWKENQFGCRDTGYQVITINPNYEIKIPNVFTPNTNGSNGGRYDPNSTNNEVFHPYLEYTEEYRLQIFNRWGELVFESKDVNIGWDGYYKNQLSQADVYVYKLEVTFINGAKATKVGDLTLLR
ncbi:MAG: PKD domain-containing protein [Vicingaceae bacterium]